MDDRDPGLGPGQLHPPPGCPAAARLRHVAAPIMQRNALTPHNDLRPSFSLVLQRAAAVLQVLVRAILRRKLV